MSLLNNEDLRDFSFLLTQEPYCFHTAENKIITPPMQHTHWAAIHPTCARPNNPPFRSMIWVAKHLRARPVPIESTDITAVTIEVSQRTLLIVSVYIPTRAAARDQTVVELLSRLQAIRDAITTIQEQNPGREVELIIAGDFNRHDELWGGDEAATPRHRGEAAGIIDFMQDLDLQSLIPRGTITFDSPNGSSTIDLTLTTDRLAAERLACYIHPTEHGSDHRAIQTNFSLSIPPPAFIPRRQFKDAPWDRIKVTVSELLATQPPQPMEEDVDASLRRIMAAVTEAIDRFVPLSKPSPYTKRWWTAELTQLRKEYTVLRNRTTAAWWAGYPAHELHEQTKAAVKKFRKRVRATKRQHWREFLECADNIWSAARFLDPEKAAMFTTIPYLTRANGAQIESNEEIGAALVENFFSPTIIDNRNMDQETQASYSQLEMELLTIEEVEAAIRSAKPSKAPGSDGLPALVWQQLWPVLKWEIFKLFNASIRSARLPQQWKIAKIIPLRKPDKPDYSLPKAYRPISLLATLGKALETVVANRISYLAEKHSLLPENHFGARRRRAPDQALLVLTESIWEAWRRKKVLSLVSFDVKGAYNGVSKDKLLERLRHRRILEALVRWIDNFCSSHQASIAVNSYTSSLHTLEQAGLPQGSRLSPVLYTFFNADLVERRISRAGGAIAFVDDYTAWVVSDTAEQNTALIQEQIVPAAKGWAESSGACFEADKTAFIHFTRNPRRECSQSLQVGGEQVAPMESVKILGVILNRQLRFVQHVARAASRGTKAALALKRIKGLRLKEARQLFTATVAPKIDYASPIWSPTASESTLHLLNRPQRIAAQAIVGAFRTVAQVTAEDEACIDPLHLRLKKQRLRFWINLHTQLMTHPVWIYRRNVSRQNAGTRFPSPLVRMKNEFEKVDVSKMETILPFCKAPWDPPPQIIIDNREEAIRRASSNQAQHYKLFTDGSSRNGLVGIGLASQDIAFYRSLTIGASRSLNTYSAELAAIKFILDEVWKATTKLVRRIYVTVFTDSQAALKSLLKPAQQGGQHLVAAILKRVQDINTRRTARVTLRWVPSHEGVEGNETAHRLAQLATETGRTTSAQLPCLKSVALGWALQEMDLPKRPTQDKVGSFSKRLDRALPGKHTKILYDNLSYGDAAILAQLRTGKCRLNAYLAAIQAVDSDRCACGAPETVQHFLLQCRRWATQRAQLIQTVRNRVNDVSYLFGGYSSALRPQGGHVDGDITSGSQTSR